MEFELSPEKAEEFPIVIARGPISEEDAIALGTYIRNTCDADGVEGAIIDCAAIEGALTPEEIYRFTPAFSREVGQSIRVAYINRPPQWPPADDQFSRDLAYNRGAHLELFESIPDAISWLRSG